MIYSQKLLGAPFYAQICEQGKREGRKRGKRIKLKRKGLSKKLKGIRAPDNVLQAAKDTERWFKTKKQGHKAAFFADKLFLEEC